MISPPLAHDELFQRGAGHTASIIPPIGLAYIAAVLERDGHKVAIIDGIAEDITVDEAVVRAREFDVVGVGVLSSYFIRSVELIEKLKAAGKTVFAGGAHATAMPESLLAKGVDHVVIGEGEMTVSELVGALAAGGSVEDIAGLAFMKEGRMVRTPRRPLIKDLDDLPMPAWHLLPMDKYKNSEARTFRSRSLSLVTSRGCKGNCTFCFKGAFGTEFRSHSPGRIVREMFFLRDQYGANDIAFWDDSFTTDKETVMEVCRLLIEGNFGVPWSCEARIDTVDEEMLRAMKAAGCELVAYGVESGSDRVLRSINKRLDTATTMRTVRLTQAVGLQIRGYFMLGLIGETEEEMRATIRFAIALAPDIATFTLLTPLPGSADHIRAQREGGTFDPLFFTKKILSEFNLPDEPVYCPQGITPERLMAIHREAYRRFYYRPAFIWRELRRIRTWQDIKRLWRGAVTLLQN